LTQAIHILLVEDNEGDILLTTEALREGKVVNKISVAKDGQSAIDLLRKSTEPGNGGMPDLVLLDVNLPKKNGHEVLQFIKEHAQLCHIPVIMLTTSSSQIDILKSYQHHANCFITKPVDMDEFLKIVTGIESFWISIVQLPIMK